MWADTGRPRFVDIVGPYKKWGGDNPDAFYQYAPIDPNRTYRVRGTRGDAVYLSLTVYGGPDDGHYSERIVGTINDRDLTFDADGNFELDDRPRRATTARTSSSSPTPCARSRATTSPSRTSGRRTEWRIEAVDPPPDAARRPTRISRVGSARRSTWLRDQANDRPAAARRTRTRSTRRTPSPQQTFGWAAGDAAYAMGRFELEAGQSLELRGRSPECAFWNMVLWNPFLHTYDYAYERVAINGEQVDYEDDGSWVDRRSRRTITGHPNWVSTQGTRTRADLVPLVPAVQNAGADNAVLR